MQIIDPGRHGHYQRGPKSTEREELMIKHITCKYVLCSGGPPCGCSGELCTAANCSSLQGGECPDLHCMGLHCSFY